MIIQDIWRAVSLTTRRQTVNQENTENQAITNFSV